ncbi:sulfite reductase [NADPH] flavoprotein alpha-component [Marinihelvus fidelis]|uniref:Sulfite reductase [NADPH] flavoprotein alpha-component n=1 Tax=Marinihelvus fidelis TaxID=2613842 RepID=A0A5N0TG48_9GAMM|nr:flavodoxin domain-containing protein [Marinihelvus fidelis]KAA9134010.1 sulfite reductase [NADPH] flavoprotein alpha-component [Marinihelvus fidelis]
MLNALRTDNSPFNEQQIAALQSSLAALSPGQSLWLSGYLAGQLAGASADIAPAAAAAAAGAPLTILYGSETGNGEAVAEALAARFEAAGQAAELKSLDGFRPAALKKLEHAVFVMSTHGEGDPPEEALDFFEFLDSDRAPKLDKLSYRVLSLGDSSYEKFCEAGRRLDERLQALGAKPWGPRVDCDVDYDAPSEAWGDEVLEHARETLGGGDAAGQPQAHAAHLSLVQAEPAPWTRLQPFSSEVLRVQKITANASEKDVHHIELSLEDSGIRYEPGDALGVWAPNDPEVVAEILDGLDIDPATTVREGDRELAVSEALAEHHEITLLTAATIEGLASAGAAEELASEYEALDDAGRRAFLERRQLADLVAAYPLKLDAQTLVDQLRPLASRSYSIASSQGLVDEEVHLTVATLASDAIGTERRGVASQFLNHRVGEGGQVRVFLEPNRRFRLPENPDTPIIMIGAGTGVAPYRAFLQELEARGTNPDTWLIFGNPHLRTDFLYQREFLQWRADGLLNRIDAAWSRDQEEKRYVQHIVAEQAERLDEWLARGAHVYLCGALAMGESVTSAIADALVNARGLDAEAAAAAVANLRREKRLLKDLY